MRFGFGGILVFSIVGAGCAASADGPAGGAAYAGSMCASGQALVGVTYDVSKSKFAFGSEPVRDDAGSLVRWSGSDGALAVFADGQVLASLNAGAPESGLATFSSDSEMLKSHVTDYFVRLGVEACQIDGAVVHGASTSTGRSDGSDTVTTALPSAVALSRGVDGIPVSDSNAYATFVIGDLTIDEGLYWPTIPADVVRDARTFRDRLNDPAMLAAYKASLPENARGDGTVMIHHTSAGTSEKFRAVAVYEVELVLPPNSLTTYQTAAFDADGKPVEGWATGDL